MLIAAVIVALIIIVAVVDIAAIVIAGRADKRMEIERPDLIDIE